MSTVTSLIYSAITDFGCESEAGRYPDREGATYASAGELEEVGGPFYITQLSSKVASSAHIEYHARIIAQKVSWHVN